jgi:hypothetical protein
MATTTTIPCEPCCPIQTDCCPTIEWPGRLYVTIHDPNNTCSCLDGLSFQLDSIETEFINVSHQWRYRPECWLLNDPSVSCNEQTVGCSQNYWFSPMRAISNTVEFNSNPTLMLFKINDIDNINQGIACDFLFNWFLSPNETGWPLLPDPPRRHHIYTSFGRQFYSCQRPINISSKIYFGGVWVNQGTRLNRTQIQYQNSDKTFGCYLDEYPINEHTVIPGMYMTITE